MKDWLIIIVSVLILLIVIDGIRRKRNERMGDIKVSRSLKKSLKHRPEIEPGEKPDYSSEFPNGGARVVNKGGVRKDTLDRGESTPSVTKPVQVKKSVKEDMFAKVEPSIPVPPKSAAVKTQTRPQASQKQPSPKQTHVPHKMRLPEQVTLNLGESIPLLMESIAEHELKAVSKGQRVEPSISAVDESLLDHDGATDKNQLYDEDINEKWEDSEEDHEYDEADDEDYEADDYQHEDSEDPNYDEESAEVAATDASLSEPEEVIIISVMAHKGHMFYGVDLLDIILKCGLRFGTMDIFHRYSDTKGEGALLFSLVNMVKPGSFDLDAMEEFQTPGISLFMTLPIKADSLHAFELMIETAQAIADALDGELKDDQRSVLTKQTLEHCRQRIRDFERKRLFRRSHRT